MRVKIVDSADLSTRSLRASDYLVIHENHRRSWEERMREDFKPEVIRVDGGREAWEGGHSLEAFQDCVGGLIEIVRLSEGRILVVDEEGRLKGKPHNPEATKISRGHVFGDIRGDALLTHESLMEEE